MNNRNCNPRRVLCMAMALAGMHSLSSGAATLVADNQLSSNCSTYNAASRNCSGGSQAGYRTLADALSAAQPGDTVSVRGGNWSEGLEPPRSGTAAQPITIRAYSGETPTLTGFNDVAITFSNVSYIVVDGIAADNVEGWVRFDNSSYNVLRNLRLTRATAGGTTGGVKFASNSRYNKLLDSTLDDGNDNLTIQQSDHNVIAGNTITEGRHSIFSVRCSSYNVIRNNTFGNSQQKIGEIYDCEGTSDAPVIYDATKRNLVDSNLFTATASASRNYDYNGIQYAGQNGIVRRNAFYDNLGGALNFQIYSDESLYSYGHRLYNNTFFNNRCNAIAASSSSTSSRYSDNRVRNNLLYKNVSCSGGSAQTEIGNTGAVILDNNAVVNSAPPFVNEASRDLHLQSSSSLIDTGVFVTTTSSAGSGTAMQVADAGWFYDGYQISGETGDLVQLSGQTQTARIVAINYTTSTLTLDQALSWTSGQGLHLAYAGSKPEPGAYESGSTSPTKVPVAPADFQVQ